MSEKTSEQDANGWKKKYHDHLDLLEQKENDWQSLESILKKTVLRLSITAEGQHPTIDRYLQEIRATVKKQVDVNKLDDTLKKISALLLKLDEKSIADDKKIVTMLARLLENTDFSNAANKQKNTLINKLSVATDDSSDALIDEVQCFLADAMKQPVDVKHETAAPGILSNLFTSNDKKTGTHNNCDSLISGLNRVTEALPWPNELQSKVNKLLKKSAANKFSDAEKYLQSLSVLVDKWQQRVNLEESDNEIISIDDDDSYPLKFQMHDQTDTSEPTNDNRNHSEAESGPSPQNILIQLLEQLTIPPDLHAQVENLKQRISDGSAAPNWKQLLKDIAQLINTLRIRMQDEKHEFENFLQQITSRLQEIDNFLSLENTVLTEAVQASDTFDVVVSAQVQDIQADIKSADDLDNLKNKVEKRLNIVSEHIKEYRINEQERYSNTQQNVTEMQSRLVELEQESGKLKKLMIEKNKEAMFDVLTKIPNRLSYEKKAAEEIARCKRFTTPLSMVVWDIDLFKQVNDTYGHKVGDKVLKAVAQILEERMRETDYIARYGGEEFVMFLPGVDEEKALVLTETLRNKIAACKFNHHGQTIKITMSCGISNFIANDDQESLFERADKALYSAKNSGRNQCVISSSLE